MWNYKTCRIKTGENLWDLGLGNKCLDLMPKAWSIKGKLINWTSPKLKTLLCKKGWRVGQTICIYEKEQSSRKDKELSKFSSKDNKCPISTWPKDMKRQFTKVDIQIANKDLKTCSTSLAIRGMQIKSSMKRKKKPSELSLHTYQNG